MSLKKIKLFFTLSSCSSFPSLYNALKGGCCRVLFSGITAVSADALLLSSVSSSYLFLRTCEHIVGCPASTSITPESFICLDLSIFDCGEREERADGNSVGAANDLLLSSASPSCVLLRTSEHLVWCPGSVSISSQSWLCPSLSIFVCGEREERDPKYFN